MNSFDFSHNAHTNSHFPGSELGSDFSYVSSPPLSNTSFQAQPSGAAAPGNFLKPQVISLNEPELPYNELERKYGGAMARVHHLSDMVANLLNDKNTMVEDKSRIVNQSQVTIANLMNDKNTLMHEKNDLMVELQNLKLASSAPRNPHWRDLNSKYVIFPFAHIHFLLL